jgi:hypothetical protein
VTLGACIYREGGSFGVGTRAGRIISRKRACLIHGYLDIRASHLCCKTTTRMYKFPTVWTKQQVVSNHTPDLQLLRFNAILNPYPDFKHSVVKKMQGAPHLVCYGERNL